MKKRINPFVYGSLIFVILCLFFAQSTQGKLPEEIIEISAENRPQIDLKWDVQELIEEFSRLLYPYDSVRDEPVLLEPSQERPYSKASITKGEALLDTEFLFSFLKYGYAAYQYFGGDAQFLKAKENIKADLEKESFPLGAYSFTKVLAGHLDFINDGHFAIGNTVLLKSKRMYMNGDYPFYRDQRGYYLKRENSKVYLQEVDSNTRKNLCGHP